MNQRQYGGFVLGDSLFLDARDECVTTGCQGTAGPWEKLHCEAPKVGKARKRRGIHGKRQDFVCVQDAHATDVNSIELQLLRGIKERWRRW